MSPLQAKTKSAQEKHDSVATWCLARNIDDKMECLTPQILDEILKNSLLKSGKIWERVRTRFASYYAGITPQVSPPKKKKIRLRHNGVAITSVSFKNLAEHLGFRDQQDHNNAYFEDFSILQMADGSKVAQFEENPNETRSSPQQMW